jgi:alpha-glucosidase (family GH31 glycosyl hydrolase)
MLKCCNLRYQLMPYIYTAARQAYDTGISICRPLYYEWPEDNESYRAEGEYMFGDDILVSPVVTAAERDGKTFQRTWLPQGQ